MMRRAAFVLGNSNYDDETAFPEIKHCKDDARAIFHLITTPPTGLFELELSKELVDVTVEKARDELDLFFDPLSKDDFVFMFFAGHGRSLSSKHIALAMQNTKDGRLARTALDASMIGAHLSEKKIQRYALFFIAAARVPSSTPPAFNHAGKAGKRLSWITCAAQGGGWLLVPEP